MSKGWRTADLSSQVGKSVVITGATSGIGYKAALALARAGAEVTLPARSLAKSEDATARIRAAAPGAEVRAEVMDLADLSTVRAFAKRESQRARPIDILINNAGIMAQPVKRTLSPDGFEMQFATNVVGHFALTGLLLQRVLAAAAPRVVMVSSLAHTQGGPVPVSDLNSEIEYKPWRAYSKTKLMNALIAVELQRRAGTRLLSVSCHPGYSRTNLQYRGEPLSLQAASVLLTPFSQNAAGGAQPTLMAATSPDVEPGGFYGPGKLFGLRGPATRTRLAAFAYDEAAGRSLFDELEHLSGVSFELDGERGRLSTS